MRDMHQKARYGMYQLQRESTILTLLYLLLLTARPVWCQGTAPEIEGKESTPMTITSTTLYAC